MHATCLGENRIECKYCASKYRRHRQADTRLLSLSLSLSFSHMTTHKFHRNECADNPHDERCNDKTTTTHRSTLQSDIKYYYTRVHSLQYMYSPSSSAKPCSLSGDKERSCTAGTDGDSTRLRFWPLLGRAPITATACSASMTTLLADLVYEPCCCSRRSWELVCL